MQTEKSKNAKSLTLQSEVDYKALNQDKRQRLKLSSLKADMLLKYETFKQRELMLENERERVRVNDLIKMSKMQLREQHKRRAEKGLEHAR